MKDDLATEGEAVADRGRPASLLSEDNDGELMLQNQNKASNTNNDCVDITQRVIEADEQTWASGWVC